MRLFRRRERAAPSEHLVATRAAIPRPSVSEPEDRADPTGDSDYAAIRRTVLKHVPTLKDAIRVATLAVDPSSSRRAIRWRRSVDCPDGSDLRGSSAPVAPQPAPAMT